MNTSVQVAVRIPPLRNCRYPDDLFKDPGQISYEENTIKILYGQESLETEFSKVFGPFTPQEDVFNFIYPIIESFDKGISSTILTYGQAGSGKTFTMFGDPDNYGIIPRVIFYIFRVLSSDYIVRLSMIEIYNEKITDLLEEIRNPKLFLCRKQHADLGTYIDNISEYIVKSPDEALSLIKKGQKNCLVNSTMMSLCSSRTNIISQINIISTRPNENGKYYRSKITLCDLYGSQKIRKTGVYTSTLNEARNINKSIKILENVVYNLTKSECSHVPYRNSILTYLLKESLEGQHRLAFIASLHPEKGFFLESYDTIKFAHIFKQIKINAINQEITYEGYKDIEKFERDNKFIKIYKKNTEEDCKAIKINQEDFQNNQNFHDGYKNTEEIQKENIILKNMMLKYIKSTENIVNVTNYDKKPFGFIEIKRNYRRSKSCSITCRRNTERFCFKKRSRSICRIDKLNIKF